MSAFSGGGKKDFDGVGWAGYPQTAPCTDATQMRW